MTAYVKYKEVLKMAGKVFDHEIQCLQNIIFFQMPIFKNFMSCLRKKLPERCFVKELSLCHKLKNFNLHIFGMYYIRPLVFQTYIIYSNLIHSLKYLRSPTLGYKDIGIRKLEFVANTQFLYESSARKMFCL